MNILLIMNENSYVGREYLSKLKDNNIIVDVSIIGTFPEIDKAEQERCLDGWCPDKQKDLQSFHNFHNFKSLKSNDFMKLLIKNKYHIGIQGGTGIIKDEVINQFSLGILNFHPGLLPNYRGCSAPEWQIYEGNNVYVTCHLIDKGIDTGDIKKKKKLDVNLENYYKFRSSIYPLIAEFMSDIIREILSFNGFKNEPYSQDENHARYLKYIGKDKIEELRKMFNKKVDLTQ